VTQEASNNTKAEAPAFINEITVGSSKRAQVAPSLPACLPASSPQMITITNKFPIDCVNNNRYTWSQKKYLKFEKKNKK